MKTGDKAKVSPDLTGENEWVAGEGIDIEKKHSKVLLLPLKTN